MTAGRFPQVWDLASLLPHPSSPEFRTCLNEYKQELLGLVTVSRSLPAVTPAAADQWAGFLEAYGRLDAISGDLRAFLECHCAAEAENPIFLQLDAEVAALSPQREEVTTNLEFALKEASSEQLDALLKADPRLEQIAYFVRTRQKNAALRLPREQELLAADLAVDGLHAWGRLYDRLCGSLRVTVS
ncbi:MAG TPA: oligoendopeptidase F, partial [Planctomycetaceae bacterium]|nr:oligoendopeptidase F [Planctomycetaceae bacterium]